MMESSSEGGVVSKGHSKGSSTLCSKRECEGRGVIVESGRCKCENEEACSSRDDCRW